VTPTHDPTPAAPTDEIHVSAVTHEQGFEALRDPWTALAKSAPEPSVFLTYEWFRAAWAWRRLDAKLAILVAQRGGETIGILPLVATRAKDSLARDLELLTVPDTQQCDLLAANGLEAAVAEAFASSLARRSDWDRLRLDYLAPSGTCARMLVTALRHARMRAVVSERGGNAFVGLEGTWDEYFKTRSRRLKKALNLAANRLAKSGQVKIEWLRPEAGNETALHGWLDVVVDISAGSWKRTTGNSLDETGPQAFIRALSESAYRCGWLSIWILRVDDRPLAMEYQLIHGDRVHALRGDFVGGAEAISPGSHLFRQLLEALFGRSLGRYYLGPGDNAYKARWTDDAEPLVRAAVYNRTARGRAAFWKEEVMKPCARTIRDRLVRVFNRNTDSAPPSPGPADESQH